MRVSRAAGTVVHIFKSSRQLAVLRRSKALLRCAVGLGPSPAGPKLREGDGRTPEGVYYVCTRNAQSKYTLFLGISYPSARDARAGYRRGEITREQLMRIRETQKQRLRPPWDTPLGGQIGIHGGGVPQGSGLADTTAGCIALLNEDIRALWEIAELGMWVHIHP